MLCDATNVLNEEAISVVPAEENVLRRDEKRVGTNISGGKRMRSEMRREMRDMGEGGR